MSPQTAPTPWIKASASGGNGDCVELRRNGETVEIRDSKDPDGPILRSSASALGALLAGARQGEFGHLSVRYEA